MTAVKRCIRINDNRARTILSSASTRGFAKRSKQRSTRFVPSSSSGRLGLVSANGPCEQCRRGRPDGYGRAEFAGSRESHGGDGRGQCGGYEGKVCSLGQKGEQLVFYNHLNPITPISPLQVWDRKWVSVSGKIPKLIIRKRNRVLCHRAKTPGNQVLSLTRRYTTLWVALRKSFWVKLMSVPRALGYQGQIDNHCQISEYDSVAESGQGVECEQ